MDWENVITRPGHPNHYLTDTGDADTTARIAARFVHGDHGGEDADHGPEEHGRLARGLSGANSGVCRATVSRVSRALRRHHKKRRL